VQKWSKVAQNPVALWRETGFFVLLVAKKTALFWIDAEFYNFMDDPEGPLAFLDLITETS
jgi:hypothetical protein